jgi:hypothetical protein
MSPEEATSRAERAKQLLQDPMLNEAFTATRDGLISALTIAKSPEEAYKAAIALQTFEVIKGCLESHIHTAKVVEFNTRKTFVEKILGR